MTEAMPSFWGNTPTCVGKTAGAFRPGRDGEKHPHVRGEDPPSVRSNGRWWETPPRAWGRRTARRATIPAWRNTPTCVGKTFVLAEPSRWRQKHPHVRGEDIIPSCVNINNLETPPRAWGRLHITSIGNIKIRNTPTCVGKTGTRTTGRRSARKHPHVRGEDRRRTTEAQPSPETPPRAWGRPAVVSSPAIFFRNTPTCVGKTIPAGSRHGSRWKHPHVRGEDAVSSEAKRGVKKHPHVRGEDRAYAPGGHGEVETPPRAWGRRSSFSGLVGKRRNTPTCVGKT